MPVSFYYWKTTFQIEKDQERILKATEAKTVYLRFFDIRIDPQTLQPYPEVPVHFNGIPKDISIIPVIYITNNTFLQMSKDSVSGLAKKVFKQISFMGKANPFKWSCTQFDCDWTLKTRDKYFLFLKQFKQVSKLKLEATIRLHQIKYLQQTGVPPVDNGVLMFYNMGKLTALPYAESSIFNSSDAKTYLPSLRSYPLELDVALPLFSWTIHSRNGKIVSVYSNLLRRNLENNANFISEKKHLFKAVTSHFYNGIYIRQGDVFKLEEMTPATLKEAATLVARYLPKNEHRQLIYYELGNLYKTPFSAETLRAVADYF